MNVNQGVHVSAGVYRWLQNAHRPDSWEANDCHNMQRLLADNSTCTYHWDTIGGPVVPDLTDLPLMQKLTLASLAIAA